MSEQGRAKRKEETHPSSGPQGQIPPDTKLLARALAELNASRKTILMYPPGHSRVQQSIDRAKATWDELLGERPEITIGTGKDGLVVGRDSLKLTDAISKGFSAILRDRDLAVVLFRRGLSSEELAAFLRVIAEDPDQARAEGGIEKALVKEGVHHIRVQCVDYSKFLHTEEEEIKKHPRGEGIEEEDPLWGGFVTHLILGTLTDSEKGISLKTADDYAPRVIATYLNSNRLDPQRALEGYQQKIQEHFSQASDTDGGMAYRVANLRNLSALLEELQPSIRNQFLDATYQQCAAQADNPMVEDLLSGMSHSLVLDMLRQANRHGNEISPTLLNLVQKIARVKEESTVGGNPNPRASRVDASDPTKHKEILDLFDREAYETYVTEDYRETLKDLSQDGARQSARMQPSTELRQELEALESPAVDAKIARALLAFMQGDTGLDEYKAYSEKVFRIANELMGEGEFSVPLQILKTLERHARERTDPAIRSAAGDQLRGFRLPAFISKALAAFDKWRDKEEGKAQAFLEAIGPDIVPQALNLYLQRDQSESDHYLFNLLALFSDRVTELAKKDVRSRRGPSLVRLIRLVRRLGTQDLIPELRPLLDRDDRQVQMEVLETLVRFRDPEAADLLRKSLHLKNAEDQLRVIEIAGMHKVTDLAEDLTSMIRTFSLFRQDYIKDEKIVEALGRIGHPCAIPALERLAKTRFSLYPKLLANIRLLVFQSLGLYENAPLGPLLRIGAKDKNPLIRASCRERMPGPAAGSSTVQQEKEEVQDTDGSPAT